MVYPGWSRTSVSGDTEQQFGLDRELLADIMQTAGCSFTHTTLPFKRIQEGVKHGTFDGTVSVSKSPERENYAWFSAPYRPEIIALFMRTEDIQSTKIHTLSDLIGTTGLIGAGIGTYHGDAFQALVKSNGKFRSRLLYTDDSSIMHIWIERHRVKMIIADLYYSLFKLRQSNLHTKILPHGFQINNEDVHLIFSKKSVPAADVAVIDAAIIKYRASERFKDVLDKYSSPY